MYWFASRVAPTLLIMVVPLWLWTGGLVEQPPKSRWLVDPALLPYAAGHWALARGQPLQAEPLFYLALRLSPEYPAAHMALGALDYQLWGAEQAIGHWSRAAQADPTLTEAHVNLALALAQQGRFQPATASIRRAIDLQPNDPALYRTLAELHLRQEEPLHARRALLEVSRLGAADATDNQQLGLLYLAEERYSLAAPYFEQALQLDPYRREARRGLAVARYGEGEMAEALRHFQQVLYVEPDDPLSHFYAGLIYEHRQEDERAIHAFGQLLRRSPRSELARRAAIHLCRLLDRGGEGVPMPD